MARGRKTVSRMRKLVANGTSQVTGGTPAVIAQTLQPEGGSEEVQVKRIMFSAAEYGPGAPSAAYKLGLFQFTPTISNFNEDDAIVISGAIGNQFTHNETITMRVPEGWYVALLIEQLDAANTSDIAYSLQLNYKVLN